MIVPRTGEQNLPASLPFRMRIYFRRAKRPSPQGISRKVSERAFVYLYRRVRLHLRRGFPGLFRGREGFGRMRPVYQEEGLTTPGRIKGRNIWSSGKEKKTGTSECLDFSKQQTSRNGITPGSERHLFGQVLYFTIRLLLITSLLPALLQQSVGFHQICILHGLCLTHF